MINVERYIPERKQEWDLFIENSKNGTFLFKRDFMDYHNDRFKDFSLMIYRKGKLISCFPASVVNNKVYSHQGLTYGGFVFNKKIRLAIAEEVLNSAIELYKTCNISSLFIKLIPSIYHNIPSNEIDYWLWHKNAIIYRKDTTAAVNLSCSLKFSDRKKRYIKKAKLNNLLVVESDDLSMFWNDILIPNLNYRYKISPVHSLSEIELLKSLFKQNINQYNVYNNDGEILAGTTLFIKGETVHAQYISANSEGTKLGALDFLFGFLIEKFKDEGFKYFDFGISNEENGNILNYSLLEYKEGFGTEIFPHDFYKLEL
ncbi:MAG: GNAT family N-acetyltransferase [Ichthyobacteriaceae bacterium]|nr:GNAT family N-acetyltransferase [Ichthyobacteriaceae bacterium]